MESDGKASAGFSDLMDTSSSPSVLCSSAVTDRFQPLVTESMTSISVHDKEKRIFYKYQLPSTFHVKYACENFFFLFAANYNYNIVQLFI